MRQARRHNCVLKAVTASARSFVDEVLTGWQRRSVGGARGPLTVRRRCRARSVDASLGAGGLSGRVATRLRPDLLHRLPQRAHRERRLLVDDAGPRAPGAERPPGGRSRAQAARRADAAGRGAPPRRRGDAGVPARARTEARCRGDGTGVVPEPRTASHQPPRIPQRGPRPVRDRRRRRGAAAARRAHRRVRQHVRRADGEPGADAGLSQGRRQGGAPGARRPRRPGRDGQVRRAQGGQPDAPRRGRALRHPRRRRRHAPVSGRRRIHVQRRSLLLLSRRADRRKPAGITPGPGAGDFDRRPARGGVRDRPAARGQYRNARHPAGRRSRPVSAGSPPPSSPRPTARWKIRCDSSSRPSWTSASASTRG